MNVRFWISAFMMISLSVAEAEAANTAPPAIRISPRSPSSPPSKSWFREKYLLGVYDTYYDYTLHRFQLDDNDRDMCPDVYKLATVYAITGQHINRIKQTCSIAVYVQKHTDIHAHYTPPEAPDLRFIQHIMVTTDVLQFLGQLICYTFEYGMIILSIILASCSTMFMIILMFCQY